MKGDRQLALLFLCFILAVALLQLAWPDRAFSPRENRFLAEFPGGGLRRLLSGEFMADYEEYVDDQFPARDAWVFLKTDLDRLFGKRENKGIYFGADGYLLPRFQPESSWLTKNTDYLNRFARQSGLPVSLILVPTATAIYPEKLPKHAPTGDQAAALGEVLARLDQSVTAPELISVLAAKKDQAIFFRTDHHWTMRGAYYAYSAWMQSREQQPSPLTAFTSQLVSSNFWGTHYAKANLRQVAPDQLELLARQPEAWVSVTYPGEGETRNSLWQPQYLEGRDQYAFFLGGNYPLVQIKTDTPNGKRLLVIKDSYAHVFVPFLTEHYQEIHLIDLRYYAASVQAYLAEQQIDEVLFLFNLQQFSSNSGLVKL